MIYICSPKEAHKNTYLVEFVQDRHVQLSEGESLLQASLAAGIPHYHAYARVIETAGDGLYAVFGFEGRITEAAQAAARAGLEIGDSARLGSPFSFYHRQELPVLSETSLLFYKNCLYFSDMRNAMQFTENKEDRGFLYEHQ